MHIHVGVFGCFHDVVAGKAWLKDMAGCMKGRPLGAGRDVFKVEKFWDGLGMAQPSSSHMSTSSHLHLLSLESHLELTHQATNYAL